MRWYRADVENVFREGGVCGLMVSVFPLLANGTTFVSLRQHFDNAVLYIVLDIFGHLMNDIY